MNKREITDEMFYKGINYAQIGMIQEAVDAFLEVIKMDPGHAYAYCNLGIACNKLGKTSEEIGAYKKAIKYKPDFAEAHYLLGKAYGTLDMQGEAIEEFNETVRIEPGHAEAYRQLGAAYEKIGLHEEAEEANRHADREEQAFDLLKKGITMEQANDFKAAITFYSDALLLEPRGRDVWYFINNNLGYCLNHFAKHQQAEPLCRAAIRTDPHRHNAFKNLGVSLEGQGRYAEAARCYIKAVQNNARDPRALRHLEELVAGHPEVSAEIPDIHEQIEKCREAVKLAGGV